MRIYITSDTHNSLELPHFKDDGTFNAIFHCGDFTNFGYMTRDSKDYIVFNKYAGIETPIYFVPGNHDIGVRNKNMIIQYMVFLFLLVIIDLIYILLGII